MDNTRKIVYLDHAATTPVDPVVKETMLPYFDEVFGNPSSLNGPGQRAREAVESAREEVASLIGARPEEIIFTSGGTESDNAALKGVALARHREGNHIVTTAVEHHAVLESCRFLEKNGFSVTYLPVDADGIVDPDDVKKALTDKTIIVSVMHANNEVGTIQPIDAIAKIVRPRGIYLHTDAVQSLGHIPVAVHELGVDLLSASGHKFYGPKGVGIIFIRKGAKFASFLHGGDQERRRRASTHNVPGIVGFAKALEIAVAGMNEEAEKITRLRDRLIAGIRERISDVRLNGHPERRLPGNVNCSIAYVEGESLLLNLDMEGIACSTGSACTSSSLEPSHVLSAMGLPPELSHGSLRFSLGRNTAAEEIDYVLAVLPSIVEKLRAISPLYKKKVKAQ
ncbi:MAG: cysteine desulfurase NifS [Smithellaceae bacterium]|nr:cysteine desulfurase NifS [Smithellaceae bacterium]